MSVNIKQKSHGIVITMFMLLTHYRAKDFNLLLENMLVENIDIWSEQSLNTIHKILMLPHPKIKAALSLEAMWNSPWI